MPLAIDASSPAVVSGAGPTATTASFTPPAGSVLQISASMDGNATPGSPTITDNLGGHLTYTLDDWQSGNNAPNAGGQAAMWRAAVVTSAAMTVSVTNGDAGASTIAVKIRVITGADTATVGAHGKSASKSAASIAQSYTAQATSGWGFIVTSDFDQTGAETAGTGCTSDGSANVGTAITYGFMRRTTADDVSGNSNTLNVTLPGTSTNLSWAYTEIKPAAAAGATYPPQTLRSRRAVPARVARTRQTVPVRAQLNPPIPVQEVVAPRRVRGLLLRRGQVRQVVPPQFNPPFPFAETTQPRRPRGAPVRRGHAPLPAPPPSDAPLFIETAQPRRWRGLLPRRARPVETVPAQVLLTAPGYPPQAVRARTKVLRWIRGHLAQPVPAQVILTPPTYPPQAVRVRTRILRWFRGRQAAPVPPQVVLTPPGWVPDRPRRARLLATGRRSRVALPPPVDAPVPDRPRGRRQPPPPLPRRPRLATPTAPQAAPPATRGPRRLLLGRQRRVPSPLPLKQQPAPPNPAFVPAAAHRRLLVAWVRRGRYAVVYRCDCATHRPGSGTTQRGAGTTTRPSTGTTVDPCC